MRAALALLTLPFALTACDINASDANGANVHIGIGSGDASGDATGNGSADHVTINVPGFNANVKLPGLDMSGHMDLDGLKLAPDSNVKGMDVFGEDKDGHDDKGHGTVHIAFTNPKDVGSLIGYYRGALADAGYAVGATTADSIEAHKNDKSFTLKASPDGAGSKGTITVVGG